MRVISGKARGCALFSPKGSTTRPTADRIKESVFNIISADLQGAAFLDLFAGSGGIGIEALSRGARKCVFVENGSEAYDALKKNLDKTRLSDYSEPYFTDVFKALAALSRRSARFNIIFMDPPYGEAHLMEALTEQIGALDILEKDGYIIGEHGIDTDIAAFKNVELLRRKNYGKTTAVSFWRPEVC